MAKPTTYVGSDVALFIEGTPAGTYLRPCGLTSHSITFSKNTTEVNVPDCDDLEAAAWVERGVESLDMNGTGNGVLAAESKDKWWGAFKSTASLKARVYIGKATDTANGGFWEGRIHITQLEIGGERGDKANVSVSFVSDGEMVFKKVTAP